MIISSNFNQNFKSRPSFSSLRLYPVKLKNIPACNQEEIVAAYFSKLTTEDIPFVRKVQNLWNKTDFGEFILDDFLKVQKFGSQLDKSEKLTYVVEKPDVADVKMRAKAFASVYVHGKSMAVDFIQTLSSQVPLERILGAGTAKMYGICKQAQEMGVGTIYLIPSSAKTCAWYRRLGFEHSVRCSFLSSDKFTTFQKNIEQKFNY